MSFRRQRLPAGACAAAALVLVAACARPLATPEPAIRLVEHAADPGASHVEVAGIGPGVRGAARTLAPASPEWARICEVRVLDAAGRASDTPVAGRYTVSGDVLRFTPLFPFDPGRQYEVRFHGAGRGEAAGRTGPLRATLAIPPGATSAPTHVTRVFPSADVVPENQLRMYIHFSAPMGRRGGLEHVTLLDEAGREVPDPFLPLEAELWNADRTRYTLFFDPGRQKRGILPNRELGPSLVAGRRYTLVIDRAWLDGNGQALDRPFSRTFRVGPPKLAPIDHAAWRIAPPAAGTRDPLRVEFPEPLDHGLLQRAIGVRRDGEAVVGEVRVEADETRWVLTPAETWRPGRYELVALPILEDPAGNRIGRAFEVGPQEPRERDTEAPATLKPFSLAAGAAPERGT